MRGLSRSRPASTSLLRPALLQGLTLLLALALRPLAAEPWYHFLKAWNQEGAALWLPSRSVWSVLGPDPVPEGRGPFSLPQVKSPGSGYV